MVNIHFLLFYCILLCAPEQQEQIQAITIKSGHTPWLSNTIMMRILMRHLSKTPHHPHSSATTCHPKWGISCLQMAHCTLFTAFFGPTFDFAVRTLVQTAADWHWQASGFSRADFPGVRSVLTRGLTDGEERSRLSPPQTSVPPRRGGWGVSSFRNIWNQARRGSGRGEKANQPTVPQHFLIFFISCLHLNEWPVTGIQVGTFWTRSFVISGTPSSHFDSVKGSLKRGPKSRVLYSKLSLPGNCTKLGRKLFLGCKPFPITDWDSGRPLSLI